MQKYLAKYMMRGDRTALQFNKAEELVVFSPGSTAVGGVAAV